MKKTVKKITVPATVKVSGKTYKVTAVSANAFKGCKKLTSVTIGKNVTSIGKKAFYKCSKLKTVIIIGIAPDKHAIIADTVNKLN